MLQKTQAMELRQKIQELVIKIENNEKPILNASTISCLHRRKS